MGSEGDDWAGFFPHRSSLEAATLAHLEHFGTSPDVEVLQNCPDDFVARAIMSAVWRDELFDAEATARTWGVSGPA
jgi:hypothetical protein